jgi:SM-20-related protein
MLDLTQIARSTLESEPYSWAAINGLFAPKVAVALAATYPLDHFKTVCGNDGEKEYRYETRALLGLGADTVAHATELTDVWRELAHDLLSPEYRTAMSLLTGYDLTAVPIEANVHHYGPGASLGPHVDLPYKLVTHVLYFNHTWSPRDGGCLRILRSGNPDDVATEILPLIGHSAVLVRSDHSWHAVQHVAEGCRKSRRSVAVTFYRPGSVSPMWPPGDATPLHRYEGTDADAEDARLAAFSAEWLRRLVLRRRAGKAQAHIPVLGGSSRPAPGGPNAEIVVEGVSPTMFAGISYPVSVTIRNTGSVPFDPVGPQEYAYRLGVRDRGGEMAWGPARLELPAPLPPGETVTLPVTLIAPSTPGVYDVEWRMVLEKVAWFGSPSDPLRIEVTPPDADILSHEVPRAMVVGHQYVGTLFVRNPSRLRWSPVGHQWHAFRLGMIGPDDRAWGILRVDFAEPVAPEETVLVRYVVLAPASPGRYHLQWRLLQEGAVWFGSPSADLTVEVTTASAVWADGRARDYFDPSSWREATNVIPGDVEEVLRSHWRYVSSARDDAD